MYRTHLHIRLGEFAEQSDNTDAPDAPETDGTTDTETDSGQLAADTGDTFEIPDDLSGLSDEDLAALSTQAREHFDTVFGDGQDLTGDDVTTLGTLTEGIEAIDAEASVREEAAAQRAEQAAAMAAKVRGTDKTGPDEQLAADTDHTEAADENEDDDADTAPAAAEDEQATESVTASADPKRETSKPLRVNLSTVRNRTRRNTSRPAAAMTMTTAPTNMRDLIQGPDNQGLDWLGVGKVVDRQLASFNLNQYKSAQRAKRHLHDESGIFTMRRHFGDELTIKSNDPGHVDEVVRRAINETRLPGGSLTASGGWCAPSEVSYEMCELESDDGIFTVPQVNISRGGLQTTTGPDWAAAFADAGFCYTEAEDEAGTYATDEETGELVEGPKPCITIPCADFEDHRLDTCGICVTAGVLQSRGYPELIARNVRGALVAHRHKMNASVIQAIVAGSTPVTFPSPQAGTTAPILSAVELQIEHMRDRNRMARNATVEAKAPYWVRPAIRADLSRRLGVDLINVTDTTINGWFAERGALIEFGYDWQSLADGTDPGDVTAYPDSVDILLYPAGTWFEGVSDVISMSNMYDSVLLGENNYTALFTEEGWFVAKTCVDSRIVTVPICPDGATHGGVDIACDGTVAAGA